VLVTAPPEPALAGSEPHRSLTVAPYRPRGEVLDLLDNDTGTHSCCTSRRHSSPVGAGRGYRHRADEPRSLGSCWPRACLAANPAPNWRSRRSGRASPSRCPPAASARGHRPADFSGQSESARSRPRTAD